MVYVFPVAAYGLCLIAIALSHSFVLLIAAEFAWGAATDALVGGCEVTLIQTFGAIWRWPWDG